MKRIAINKNDQAIKTLTKEAEAMLDKLKAARRIAEAVTQAPVESLTGEKELENMLRAGSYPNAPLKTLADLNGIGREFMQHSDLVGQLHGLDRFELVDGEAKVKDSYLEQITELHTSYVEGEKAKQWEQLQELLAKFEETQAMFSVPLDRLLQFNPRLKTVKVNPIQFQLTR